MSHHLVGSQLMPLLPFISDDFSLNKTQAGFLGSAYNLPYGISQIPAGWLADRVGPRVLILIGISGVAVAGLLVGISPSYIVMAVFLMILGLVGGGYHPSASPLVAASVDERNQGRALGLHQIGGTGSFFLTPLVAAAIASTWGWRASFISLGAVALVLGITLYIILGRRGIGVVRKQKQDTAIEEIAAPAVPGQYRRLFFFTLLCVAAQLLIYSTVAFVPLYAKDMLGSSEQLAASLPAFSYFAGFYAGPLGGYLSDRIGKVPVLVTAGLIAGPAIYLLTQVSMGWSISAVLLLMGTCQYVVMPVTESYIIAHTSKKNRSTILGIYYFASRGGPGIVMPALGAIIDNSGYTTCFTVAGAATAALVIFCTMFLIGKRN